MNMSDILAKQSSFKLEQFNRPKLVWKEGTGRVSITGEISGPFMVHDAESGRIALTHLPTGFRIATARNRELARNCAADLSGFHWEGVRVEDGKTIGFSDAEMQEVLRIRSVYMS